MTDQDRGLREIYYSSIDFISESGENPQTLLFSATVPPWVLQIAKKYLKQDYKTVDLVGKEGVQTSTTVKVDIHESIRRGIIVNYKGGDKSISNF